MQSTQDTERQVEIEAAMRRYQTSRTPALSARNHRDLRASAARWEDDYRRHLLERVKEGLYRRSHFDKTGSIDFITTFDSARIAWLVKELGDAVCASRVTQYNHSTQKQSQAITQTGKQQQECRPETSKTSERASENNRKWHGSQEATAPQPSAKRRWAPP